MPTKKQSTYKIVRTRDAGVFAGDLVSRDGTEAIMRNVRRIWYWCGAASLSQMAREGVKKPDQCKFSVAVEEELLLGVIEILSVTPAAQANIQAVPEWKC